MQQARKQLITGVALMLFSGLMIALWNPFSRRPNFPGQCHDSKEDSYYLIIGVDQAGADTMGIIKVRLHRALSPNHSVTRANATEVTATIAKQTFRPPNTWLDWITYTASVSNMTDCVACSAACPTLFTVPVPLLFWENRPGIDCMLPLPPPVFSPCLTRVNATPVGAPDDLSCAKIINVTKWENMSSINVA